MVRIGASNSSNSNPAGSLLLSFPPRPSTRARRRAIPLSRNPAAAQSAVTNSICNQQFHPQSAISN